MSLPRSIQNTIDEFSKLPGVGPKTAARLCFYLLTKPDSDIKKLGNTIAALKDNLKTCEVCYNIAEDNPCTICQDGKRDEKLLCVVEEPLDVLALEKTNYTGTYHVLGGVISPVDGIGPDNIRIFELLKRLQNNKFNEIILATDPSLEGEATAMYIQKKIAELKKTDKIDSDLKITRLARGLPIGGDLEYADELTLKRAIEGRESL